MSSISDINTMSVEQFCWIFGNVVELCTAAATDVAARRPFSKVEELCNGFAAYLEELPVEEKVNILRLHPDLAGALATGGGLTSESASEQSAAGLTHLPQEQLQLIQYYNQHYKEKFGFPFVVCARENKVDAIIEGLMRRYNNVRAQELQTAIEEVKKICRLRIMDLVHES